MDDLNTTCNVSLGARAVSRRNVHTMVPYFTVVSIIALSGTLGNLLFIMSFVREKRLRTVSNFLIGHLALVDMLTCCIIIPWNMMITSGGASISSCRYSSRILTLLPHLSMQTQCLISCNRYFLVTKCRMVYCKWFSKTHAVFYIITGWIVSICAVMFVALFAEKPVNLDVTYCDSGVDVTGTRLLNNCLLSVFAGIYFLISVVFYVMLISFVRKNPLQLDAAKRRECKTSLTLFLLLSLFVVSLIIAPVVLYISSVLKVNACGNCFGVIDQVVICILLMSYCINPIFYGFRIRHFKDTVKSMMLPCTSNAIHPIGNQAQGGVARTRIIRVIGINNIDRQINQPSRHVINGETPTG